jgi:tetratricopeptide (TPR) repeat protein
MHPTHAAILHELGRLALAQQQLEIAEGAFRALVLAPRPAGPDGDAIPTRSELYLELGDMALSKGETDRAADLLDSAFHAALESPAELPRFEQALRARERFELLARAISRRYETSATTAERVRAFGDLVELWAEALGRPEELGATLRSKLESLAAELEQSPMEDVDAWHALSGACLRLDDQNRFIALLESTLPRLSRAARARLRLSLAEVLLGDPARTAEAIGALRSVLEENPEAVEAAELLSSVLAREGRLEELAALLAQRLALLEKSPDTPVTAFARLGIELGSLLERLGRGAEALPIYEAVLDRAPDGGALVKLAPRLAALDSARLIDCLERLVATDPAPVAVLVKDLLSGIDPGAAPELVQRALAVAFAADPDPRDAELLGVRAALREATGDEDGALSDLERASALDARFRPGAIELLQKRVDRGAASDLDEQVIRLVDLLLGAEQGARARAELERLLGRAPSHKQGLWRMATLASTEGDWQLATSAYHELFPLLDGTDELREVALALCETCERAGRVADARSPLERALELSPEDAVLQQKLEQIYEAAGDFGRLARALTARADQAEPAERTRLLARAARILLENAHDVHYALSTLERVRATDPHDPEANLLWAKAERTLGRTDRALEVLRETLHANRGKRSPLVASLQLEIAHAHLAGDELFEAFDALKAGFNLDRKNVELALLLGLVALDLDDDKTAERALLAVISLPAADPGTSAETRATAFFHLGALAHLKGDLARARRMLGKATTENPNHEAARALLEALAPRAAAAG